MAKGEQTLEQVCDELLLLPPGRLRGSDVAFVKRTAKAIRDGYVIGGTAWRKLSELHNKATAADACAHKRGEGCALLSRRAGEAVRCAFPDDLRSCDDYAYLFAIGRSQ